MPTNIGPSPRHNNNVGPTALTVIAPTLYHHIGSADIPTIEEAFTLLIACVAAIAGEGRLTQKADAAADIMWASTKAASLLYVTAFTRRLWGGHFWSPSYCVVSCGGAPLEIIKQYVEQQRAPDRNRKKQARRLTPP